MSYFRLQVIRNLIDYSTKKCCNHDYFFDYFSITFQQLHFDNIIKLLKHIAEL